jgi:hypothetical protein
MRRMTRALALAMLCLACANNTRSQSASEAEENLKQAAKRFQSSLTTLKQENQEFNSMEEKERDEKRDKYISDTRNFMASKVKPSFKELTQAFDNYRKAARTSADKESSDKAETVTIAPFMSKIETGFEELDNDIYKKTTITKTIEKSQQDIAPALEQLFRNLQASSAVKGGGNGKGPVSTEPLSNANGKRDAEDENNNKSWSFFDYLWWSIPFILLVSICGAGAWWLKQTINNIHGRITAIQRGNSADLSETKNNVNKLAIAVSENKNGLETLQNRTLPALEAHIRNSLAKFEIAAQGNRSRESMIHSYDSALSLPNHAPQQKTVAEYLTRARGDSIKAKKVLMRADALQEASDGDEIYILSPDERHHGMFKAIPNYPRFSSSQDFSHYAPFYDCDEPSSGEVWIIEPALATYETESNQWRLSKKGKMQIN